MRFDDTIGAVRKCIDEYAVDLGGAYALRAAFPSKQYDDDLATLRQLGLTPNATMMMHVVAEERGKVVTTMRL